VGLYGYDVEFLVYLSIYQLVKKDSTPWNGLVGCYLPSSVLVMVLASLPCNNVGLANDFQN
jgi:hypothetical protein